MYNIYFLFSSPPPSENIWLILANFLMSEYKIHKKFIKNSENVQEDIVNM